MRNLILIFSVSLISFGSHASGKLSDFILEFNEFRSSCDQISIEKTRTSEGTVLQIALLDLAELGNEEFKAGVPLKKFERKGKNKVVGKRFSRFDGKRVKEVFTFEKNENGSLKTVSLKRFKKSFIRYTYPLGGIICRAE